MKLKYDDKYHSYWLDGHRCKGATSVASYPENRYNIERWQQRMVLSGGALNAGLMQRVAAHINDRDKLDQFAEEAIQLARGHEASADGTAAHRITELIDLGADIIDTPLAARVRQAWIEAIEEAGCVIDPDYVERIVVYPEHRICGTFDRLVRHLETGQLVVLDLKTGENAVKYPHPVAVQLAIYANAPLIAERLPTSGGVTTNFDPMPKDINKDHGLIVHMPAEGQVEVHKIDIKLGWRAFVNVCLPIIKWRDTAAGQLIGQQISAATWAPTPRLVTADGAVESPDPPPVAPVPSTISTARLHWIEARCRKLVDQGHGQALMLEWPAGVPYFRDGGPRTNDQINEIAAACDRVETATGMAAPPFRDGWPTPQQKEQKHEHV